MAASRGAGLRRTRSPEAERGNGEPASLRRDLASGGEAEPPVSQPHPPTPRSLLRSRPGGCWTRAGAPPRPGRWLVCDGGKGQDVTDGRPPGRGKPGRPRCSAGRRRAPRRAPRCERERRGRNHRRGGGLARGP